MKELKEIIKAYDDCQISGLKTALVTVVHVIGSSYRGPGARMLIDEKGNLTGAISGGCLEGDALRKALLAISQQQLKLVTYDTNNEDDAAFGVQLGCEGIIQVLFEPINNEAELNAISLFRQIVSKRENFVLLTFFNAEEKNANQIGTRILVDSKGPYSNPSKLLIDNKVENYELIRELKNEIILEAQLYLINNISAFRKYAWENKSITVFFEFITPPISLFIVGAGNDAIPLVNIADLMGWEVSVVDGRNTHAKSERFIAACTVLVSKPEKVLENITIDSQTAFVLMTHNYNYDLAMLRILLTKIVKYIGILGPKKKLVRMLEELTKEGVKLTPTQLKSIYGPVGLDIGAETSEEIALSIVSEIKAFFSNKKGKFLKNKKQAIHSERAKIENK